MGHSSVSFTERWFVLRWLLKRPRRPLRNKSVSAPHKSLWSFFNICCIRGDNSVWNRRFNRWASTGGGGGYYIPGPELQPRPGAACLPRGATQEQAAQIKHITIEWTPPTRSLRFAASLCARATGYIHNRLFGSRTFLLRVVKESRS